MMRGKGEDRRLAIYILFFLLLEHLTISRSFSFTSHIRTSFASVGDSNRGSCIGPTSRCTRDVVSNGGGLMARPKRLEDNAEGVLYVNDQVSSFPYLSIFDSLLESIQLLEK